MKFNCQIENSYGNWVSVAVRPDYCDGRNSGPVAWLSPSEEPEKATGVALAVSGCIRTAIEHSISWVNPAQGQTRDWMLDDNPASFEEWENELVEACQAAR